MIIKKLSVQFLGLAFFVQDKVVCGMVDKGDNALLCQLILGVYGAFQPVLRRPLFRICMEHRRLVYTRANILDSHKKAIQEAILKYDAMFQYFHNNEEYVNQLNQLKLLWAMDMCFCEQHTSAYNEFTIMVEQNSEVLSKFIDNSSTELIARFQVLCKLIECKTLFNSVIYTVKKAKQYKFQLDKQIIVRFTLRLILVLHIAYCAHLPIGV